MKWLHRILGISFLILIGWASLLYFGMDFSTDPADRPVSVIQSRSPLRIAFVGTSLTASYNWPEAVNDCVGRPVLAWRITLAGAASDWAISQVDVISSRRPDLVFIEFSINDADLRHGITLRDSARNHRQLIRDLRTRMPELQIVLMTMSPAHGIRRLLRPRLPSYYRLYRNLAEELETGLLDLYPRWLSVPRSARKQGDGLHPSAAAASQVILPALSSYLGITC